MLTVAGSGDGANGLHEIWTDRQTVLSGFVGFLVGNCLILRYDMKWKVNIFYLQKVYNSFKLRRYKYIYT